jgi:uncharacterized protein (TIGR00730 family)
MTTMRRVGVFCGSSPGADAAHARSAVELGTALVSRGLGLVYGGGHVGLMGVLADAVLAAGGEVLGVITASLQEREVGHDGLTELRVVDTMHERKAAMADAADAFVMLPGGIGTLDEFFEAVTWAQLGIHDKPCAVLDPTGYYAPLLRFLDDAVRARFIAPQHRALVLRASSPDALFDELAAWTPPDTDKWLDRADR